MPHPILPDLTLLRRSWPEYAAPSTTRQVRVGNQSIGGDRPVVIAGPCTVESMEQTLAIAYAVRDCGVRMMRGGAYKPRTNPHAFQGLGIEGLEILAEVREKTGLLIVTEVLDPRLVETVSKYADMIQIGSRSMQNTPLLTEVGRGKLPVLLKRNWSATLEEWLCAAEYIAAGGNREIVFCERGVRTASHDDYARAVLDLNVIEPLRAATPLPVIVDPSHSTGSWDRVARMSRAALAAGAQGLLVEVVESGADRARLLCDGRQGIPPEVLAEIMESIGGPVPAPVTES